MHVVDIHAKLQEKVVFLTCKDALLTDLQWTERIYIFISGELTNPSVWSFLKYWYKLKTIF